MQPKMRLYKFVRAGRIKYILDGWIRFTQPGAFNDPFEIPAMKMAELEERPDDFLGAAVDQTRDIQEELSRNPLRVPSAAWVPTMFYWGKTRANEASSLTEEERARRLQVSKEKISKIDKRFGILSLSQDGPLGPARGNFLLWAHYADEHRGAVFELDIDDPEFSGSYRAKDGIEERRPVSYVSERPKLPFEDEILQEHFFKKSPHWDYEAEYRIVRQLEHHDDVKQQRSPYPVYLYRLPASCIRSITLGARFDATARQDLARRIGADSRLRHIEVECAKLNPQQFALEFEKIPPAD